MSIYKPTVNQVGVKYKYQAQNNEYLVKTHVQKKNLNAPSELILFQYYEDRRELPTRKKTDGLKSDALIQGLLQF